MAHREPQKDQPAAKSQATSGSSGSPAASHEHAGYQLLPEYSLKNWKPPKEVKETIENFTRHL